MPTPPRLPVQAGCPLALAVAAALVALVALGFSHVTGHPYGDRGWGLYLLEFLVIGLPFGVLAVARTRDWLGWLFAVALTVGVWGWYLYDLDQETGVNFLLGFIQLLAAPLIISGLALATAGMRGKIPDWGVDAE